jgi:hypothetical protein
MDNLRNDNAPGKGREVGKAQATDAGEHTKQARILEALRSPDGLNRFEAERLGDHCLNSTIAKLRECGIAIHSAWETVPSRFSKRGARVLRYWAWWGAS